MCLSGRQPGAGRAAYLLHRYGSSPPWQRPAAQRVTRRCHAPRFRLTSGAPPTSMQAASDVIAPVDGEVLEANEALSDNAAAVSALGRGGA